MAITTLNRRLDKLQDAWRSLQAGVDRQAAKALREAGASLDVDPAHWPQDCLGRLALVGWTVQHAQAILERAQDDSRTIRIFWDDSGAPELSEDADELPAPAAQADAPAQQLPDVQTPDAPKMEYTRYVAPGAPTRKPFPWESKPKRYSRLRSL